MQVRSYAKINWALRVIGKRSDGYHDLETLFQTISLFDTLTFTEAASLSITCSDPTIPTDGTNLVVRAARALGIERIAIHIDKRIPAGGGLGGGSSNAAATLQALSAMAGIAEPLEAIALSLGSDVPFFLRGGTAYATGRGELLEPLSPVPPIPLIVVIPEVRMATPDAFRSLQRFSSALGLARFKEIAREPLTHAAEMVNDFEAPVFAQLPELAIIRRTLLESGAVWARMSGSGSTIVGAFASETARDLALPHLREWRAEPAHTVPPEP